VQDDILTKLAKIADLKVISRTSVMGYRGKRDSASDWARAWRFTCARRNCSTFWWQGACKRAVSGHPHLTSAYGRTTTKATSKRHSQFQSEIAQKVARNCTPRFQLLRKLHSTATQPATLLRMTFMFEPTTFC
jgi:hypothetical protein